MARNSRTQLSRVARKIKAEVIVQKYDFLLGFFCVETKGFKATIGDEIPNGVFHQYVINILTYLSLYIEF